MKEVAFRNIQFIFVTLDMVCRIVGIIFLTKIFRDKTYAGMFDPFISYSPDGDVEIFATPFNQTLHAM